jgi:hypothetical protein
VLGFPRPNSCTDPALIEAARAKAAISSNPAILISGIVMSQAQHVTVNHSRIGEVANWFSLREVNIPTWDWEPVYPVDEISFAEWAKYCLVFNCQNAFYDFKADGNECGGLVRFKGKTRAGVDLDEANLLAARVTENWDVLREPKFLAAIPYQFALNKFFLSDHGIPMIDERVQSMRSIGRYLSELEAQGRTFEDVVRDKNGDALSVAKEIASISGFHDPFMKRAQLSVAMMYGRFQRNETSLIQQKSISGLSVFADYLLPKALYAMGIIDYTCELRERIAKEEFIEEGSAEEMEIRASTVEATQQLLSAINERRAKPIDILGLDYLLWKTGQDMETHTYPEVVDPARVLQHHLTKTLRY